ncbi:MAG: FkbM family methyltransferase [Hyphomonadaceae bacterium]
MSLPRISRRRRRWLNANLPAGAKHWVEQRDPFYLIAESPDIIARSIEIARARLRLRAAKDRVFVDLGFNNRRVFDQFYAALGADYRWFGFEIQKPLYEQAIADQGRYVTGPAEFVHGAAAEADGSIEIAIEGKADGHYTYDGSTTVASLVRDKANAPRVRVPAYDLAHFLAARTSEETAIVVKMDIEGGEYALLPHLLQSEIAPRIDLVFCEFHWRRFPLGERAKRLFQTERLIADYRDRGALLLSWR